MELRAESITTGKVLPNFICFQIFTVHKRELTGVLQRPSHLAGLRSTRSLIVDENHCSLLQEGIHVRLSGEVLSSLQFPQSTESRDLEPQ